jgi:DNA-binding NtrC family response regulator
MEKQQTVLVVDDEPGILHAVADALTDEGYVVWKARDGAEGLALALVNKPDAIISNIMMPHLDGIQLAAELQTRGLQIPMVLMSANNEPPGRKGVTFISKPFDLDRMLEIVERVLET